MSINLDKHNFITVDSGTLRRTKRELFNLSHKLEPKQLNRILKKAAQPIVRQIRANSKSSRIAAMVGITASHKWTGGAGIRIGVVKNSKTLFPDLSAQGLASIIEYGTKERYRRAGLTKAVALGKVTPTPFIRPAYEGGKGAMINEIEKQITEAVK
jgi:HK97 gp10 family phage protein